MNAVVPNTISASIATPLALTPARQSGQTTAAIQRALDKSGDTPWQVSTLKVDDPQGLFVPASILNEARRQLFEELTTQHQTARQTRRAEACALFAVNAAPVTDKTKADAPPRWSVKVDLAGPAQAALATADEIVLHLGHLPPADARHRLEAWLTHAPRTRLRLALPLITRQHEEEVLRATVSALLADVWEKWECASLGGWQILQDATRATLDLTADWSLYGLNHAAREQLAELGFSRAVASPEDTEENIFALASRRAPELEVLAWQQTPLFISETPPLVGEKNAPPWTLVNRRGGRLNTHRLDNRWVTIAEVPFCVAAHLPALQRHGVSWFRADFLWSLPAAGTIASCWEELRAGRTPESAHMGNYQRGLA